jgi:hypothetical protein
LTSGANELKKMLSSLGLFLPVIGLLAIFHFWGEWAREREWWWITGDKDGMTFLDLTNRKFDENHVLSTYSNVGHVGQQADEFDIEWDCEQQQISWGELWFLDKQMQQIDRRPALSSLSSWHKASNKLEKNILSVACASVSERAKLPTVQIERSPIEVNKIAIALLKIGILPHNSLLLATLSPKKDAVGYERMMSRIVPQGKRSEVRTITGAKN